MVTVNNKGTLFRWMHEFSNSNCSILDRHVFGIDILPQNFIISVRYLSTESVDP